MSQTSRPAASAEALGEVQRGRAPGEVAQQDVELRAVGRVVARREPRLLELAERGHERLGDVLAAVGPVAVRDAASLLMRRRPPRSPRRPSRERAQLLGVLDARRRLGAAGDVDRVRPHRGDRRADVLRGQPAAEDERDRRRARRREVPVERLARPAPLARLVRVEQVEVGVEGRQRLEVGAGAHARRLDDLRAGAPRDLGAVRRALVAVELDHAEADAVGDGRDLVQRRVDEHPGDEGLRRSRAAIWPRAARSGAASRARRSARAPRRRPRRRARVVEGGMPSSGAGAPFILGSRHLVEGPG